MERFLSAAQAKGGLLPSRKKVGSLFLLCLLVFDSASFYYSRVRRLLRALCEQGRSALTLEAERGGRKTTVVEGRFGQPWDELVSYANGETGPSEARKTTTGPRTNPGRRATEKSRCVYCFCWYVWFVCKRRLLTLDGKKKKVFRDLAPSRFGEVGKADVFGLRCRCSVY